MSQTAPSIWATGDRTIPCPRCKVIPKFATAYCSECGYVHGRDDLPPDLCYRCEGTGKLGPLTDCYQCDGNGLLADRCVLCGSKTRDYRIEVAHFVKDNTPIFCWHTWHDSVKPSPHLSGERDTENPA